MSEFILGISAWYHDAAACLVRDGELVAAAQEERFTRKKHDPSFPTHAIDYCLREAGLASPSALSHVAFYDKPIVKFDRLLASYLGYAPRGLKSFLKAMPVWLKDKLWARDRIREQLGYDGEVWFTEHHEAHAASAFFPSPFDRAAVLTVDGVGEWATASLGLGSGNRVALRREIHFPHSLGLLYTAFTYYLGFTVNSAEYKVMGLAPYGSPRYADRIMDELVELYPDGSFRLDLNYFDYPAGLKMTSPRFDRLFDGPPRRPESELGQREMDIAASIQEVTERVMLHLAAAAHAATGAGDLVMAGGVALNCVANGRILREGPFERLWIQPAAGDAGGALGAALFAHHQLLGGGRDPDGEGDRQRGSLLGPTFRDDDIAGFLDRHGLEAERYVDLDTLTEQVTDQLDAGKVVGWFQGRMEFGPRALGARSVLGDPRRPEMQSRINRRIKFRESFRPFAPAVLEEHAEGWFELDAGSPYMLLVAPVHPHRRKQPDGAAQGLAKLGQIRSEIPAVTHVDDSARIQTVGDDANPAYRRLLEIFYERTGCPVLVNTSMNVRGEPIVCTPWDAYRCFLRTDMDVLVLGSYVLEKDRNRLPTLDMTAFETDQPGYGESADERRLAAIHDKAARRAGFLAPAVLALFTLLSLSRGHPLRASVLVAAAVAILLANLRSFDRWRAAFALFLRAAKALSRLVTLALLGSGYYLVLTPYAWAVRLFGKRPLDLGFGTGATSAWHDRAAEEPTPERYQQQH